MRERGSALMLLAAYARRLWLQIAALSALGFVGTGLTALQPMLVSAILAVILGGAGAASGGLWDLNGAGGYVLGWLGILEFGRLRASVILGALFVGQACAAAALDYGTALLALVIRGRGAQMIQVDLVRTVLSMRLGFFHRHRAGELMSRVTNDAANAGYALGPIVRGFIISAGQVVVYGAYLVSTDAWLTVGAVGFIAVHFAFSQALRVPLRARMRDTTDVMGGLTAVLQEMLTSIRVIKSFGAERHEEAKIGAHVLRVRDAGMSEGRVTRLEEPVRSVLDAMAVVGILLLAVVRLGAGSLSTPGLLMYLFVGRQIIAPINTIARTYVLAMATVAAAGRVAELFAQAPARPEGTEAKDRFDGRIELRDVTFSYGELRAVEQVSFTIEKGEVVALVGPSGAGKSTIADLVLGLYEPAGGSILLDGTEVRRYRAADYRRLFGVVPQETLLYHDTIASNIRYGRDGVTDADVLGAARAAHAEAFIEGLPDGYATVVGDRGVRLSGGERQRVAIARAVVHRPHILILDEATSSVDAESERHIQSAMAGILAGATALIIAHRLSTVVRADKIVVLNEGRVVDIGRHADLLPRCALYRALCAGQLEEQLTP